MVVADRPFPDDRRHSGRGPAVRWVLHRAIDRIVDSAVARAAAHDNQTPHRASRVLSHATGLDEARKTQRAATMGTILKTSSTFVIFIMVR